MEGVKVEVEKQGHSIFSPVQKHHRRPVKKTTQVFEKNVRLKNKV